MHVGQKIEKLKSFADYQMNQIILPFWMKNLPDEVNGGFIGEIDMENHRNLQAPKGIILNARILWTFSAVYGFRNLPEYLELAQRAILYIENYFFDRKEKGYYWMLNPDGTVKNARKQIYAQAFVIYALSEYGLQTGDERVKETAMDILNLVEDKSFDVKKNGYFEAFSRDWGGIEDLRLSSLDMNEKKTMNTHLHIIEAYTRLFLLTRDEAIAGRIKNLLSVFYNLILDEEKKHLDLFFDENWTLKSTAISYGHDIESAWLLRESAIAIEDREEIDRFSDVCLNLANSALDAIRPKGGMIHEFDRIKDTEEEYEWWAQAEAIVGFVEAWKITGEEKYLDLALGIKEFIEGYFVDRKYGEWYYRVDKHGKPLNGYEKAGFWKCPYHSVRMCLELLKL
jgi:mannobiose 2-epimerase